MTSYRGHNVHRLETERLVLGADSEVVTARFHVHDCLRQRAWYGATIADCEGFIDVMIAKGAARLCTYCGTDTIIAPGGKILTCPGCGFTEDRVKGVALRR
jgi:ribosomal protein S27AE